MTTAYPAVTSNGAVTSFVPLTTTFTPSSRCGEYFRLNGPSLVAFDPGYGLDVDTAVRCVPSAVTTWWEQGRLGVDGEGHTAISLGPLVCPYEWQTVATSIEDESSTLAMCCPSGYYLGNGVPGSIVGDCRSDVSAGMVLTYASTSTDNSNAWHTETTSLTRSSTVGAIAIVGWNIKLATPTTTSSSRIETTTSSAAVSPNSISVSSSSPISSSPVSSSPIPLSSIPSSSIPSSSIPSSSILSSPENNSSQISPGVATGIGVGVGLGVIGTASLLAALCLMRRRKRKRLAEVPQIHHHELYEGDPTKHELHDPQTGRHELYGHFQHLGQYQGPPPPAELHE
ncbi:hypothetical protein F4677DRAFT_198805 [Hypoxylon crocopeplum]|nr:hypothetical protein F4677DRAFT_198805 [Hypoxylon crocopeplum]